jgi:hypothetical protein
MTEHWKQVTCTCILPVVMVDHQITKIIIKLSCHAQCVHVITANSQQGAEAVDLEHGEQL